MSETESLSGETLTGKIPTGKIPTGKILTPAAQRALAEAEARRAEIDARAEEIRREREINGRGGLEPVRYDDWEVKGLATDF